MRSLRTSLLISFVFMAPGSLAHAQGAEPADKTGSSASAGVTKEEVNLLRDEVAAQRKTIEKLKAIVQQLAEARSQTAAAVQTDAAGQSVNGPRLINAALVAGPEPSEAAQAAKPEDKTAQEKPAEKKAEEKPAEKKSEVPVVAGWNGEHFFVKSADNKFQIQPYGYFQPDYRAYTGDGHPQNTFLIRRGRFGFQGNFGTKYDYAVLMDAAASNGLSLRDLFINIKPHSAFVFQVGQFKEPFAQELLTAATNLDFVERSVGSLLYPSASTAYRSPGATIRGDLNGGVAQYWLGAFNGKGILTNNTTDEPEIIGRLRFYPWKKKKDHVLQGFAFGGAYGHGRSRGLSNELSFNAAMPDAAYTFFPQFRINGRIERYNGELTWTHGPWAVRAEYDQLNQFRRGVGSEQANALGFTDLPTIIARAGSGQVTYLLTGETRPENGTPKVKHPFLGPSPDAKPARGWGAWELAFRYDGIWAKEPGLDQLKAFTPGFVASFDDHTDRFTFGVNWYLNYLIKYQINLSIDRLKDPSVLGQEPQNFYVFLQRLQLRF